MRLDLMSREARVYCSKCGERLAVDAHFCSSCGAPTDAAAATDDDNRTTASIDVGALDETGGVEGQVELKAGTGMLVVIRGPNAGSRFLLDRDVTVIGRHPDAEIFLHDITVSRRHAEVRREGGLLVLHDLGSLNGTYVNGLEVEERTLQGGDEVQVGRFKLLYLEGGPEAEGS